MAAIGPCHVPERHFSTHKTTVPLWDAPLPLTKGANLRVALETALQQENVELLQHGLGRCVRRRVALEDAGNQLTVKRLVAAWTGVAKGVRGSGEGGTARGLGRQ